MKSLGLFLAFFWLSNTCFGQASSPAASPEKLPTGQVLERVVSLTNPEQSYALYLPSRYLPDHSWPVFFAFDPGARGKIPVELMKDAAEQHGFIVLGSNNSRNGAWKPEIDAADAMLQDAQQRFAVDLKRLYFAGFSGGARVASQLAQLCKCAAGVLLSGAGFSEHSPPLRETAFPVFSSVGNLDFNYSELIPLQEKLEQTGYPHWLRVFDGRHEWAPAEVMGEAFAWFRIQAMSSNREPRDDAFIAAQWKAAVSAAEKFATNGDAVSAWRHYKQIAATFDGLANVAETRFKAEALSQTKEVRDALKRERSDLEEQERLSSQILAAIEARRNWEAPRSSEEQTNTVGDVRDLRIRSEKEKKPEHAVVLKRALAGIFIGAIEIGNEALEKKDYRAAERYFSVAAEAKPEAEWPLRQLAIAQALDKDPKGTVETLRRIKPSDPAEFQKWLTLEPAFQMLREKHELPL